eukprot:COSAG04_NODE_131_length_24280_cov_40.563418_3_plen_253_part_00
MPLVVLAGCWHECMCAWPRRKQQLSCSALLFHHSCNTRAGSGQGPASDRPTITRIAPAPGSLQSVTVYVPGRATAAAAGRRGRVVQRRRPVPSGAAELKTTAAPAPAQSSTASIRSGAEAPVDPSETKAPGEAPLAFREVQRGACRRKPRNTPPRLQDARLSSGPAKPPRVPRALRTENPEQRASAWLRRRHTVDSRSSTTLPASQKRFSRDSFACGEARRRAGRVSTAPARPAERSSAANSSAVGSRDWIS